MRGYGGIGRHARFRFWWATVQVQVLLPAPERFWLQGLSFASVAQLVEQGTENPRVDGSIPSGGTIYANVAHLVERHLAKVEVASSSLVVRSNFLAS